jgi:hypothetical protein
VKHDDPRKANGGSRNHHGYTCAHAKQDVNAGSTRSGKPTHRMREALQRALKHIRGCSACRRFYNGKTIAELSRMAAG